ncbi:MAG: hypothetical protein ACJAT4_000224 [Granulosicoccus sp.]|jgi:hypothetical protein
MNSSEIKEILHEMIVETEDFETLEKVKNYFFYLKNRKTDWRTQLSEEKKESTEKAIKKIETGEFQTHENIRKEFNLQLKNKLKAAAENVKSGKGISLEEFRRESEVWAKTKK